MSAGPEVAVVTLCSSARLDHLRRQLAATGELGRRRVVVWLEDGPLPELDNVTLCRRPPGEHGFGLAAGRNLGARRALEFGAELVVFLDADCVPAPDLLARYVNAARSHPDAVLCGPVTYLPEGVVPGPAVDLSAWTAPHSVRPNPPSGSLVMASTEEYNLFWSLSFAITSAGWQRSGGFDEAYQGYGAEDTDYARRLLAQHIPLIWVGGAHAYHQYHPVSSPPWQHLSDIVRNAGLFFDRWGEWPMTGWLDAFREGGGVEFVGGRYRAVEGSRDQPGTSAAPAQER